MYLMIVVTSYSGSHGAARKDQYTLGRAFDAQKSLLPKKFITTKGGVYFSKYLLPSNQKSSLREPLVFSKKLWFSKNFGKEMEGTAIFVSFCGKTSLGDFCCFEKLGLLVLVGGGVRFFVYDHSSFVIKTSFFDFRRIHVKGFLMGKMSKLIQQDFVELP